MSTQTRKPPSIEQASIKRGQTQLISNVEDYVLRPKASPHITSAMKREKRETLIDTLPNKPKL
jgi:hypothetical protein